MTNIIDMYIYIRFCTNDKSLTSIVLHEERKKEIIEIIIL